MRGTRNVQMPVSEFNNSESMGSRALRGAFDVNRGITITIAGELKDQESLRRGSDDLDVRPTFQAAYLPAALLGLVDSL